MQGIAMDSLITAAAQALAAGDIAGPFAFQYTVPIWASPGSTGLQPELALVYSSSAPDGIVGPGWAFTGIPAITRCPKTLFQDDTTAAVSFSIQDRYCLNGQRLVAVTGSSMVRT